MDDLFERLARDLEGVGEADGPARLARWFATGQALAGRSAPSPPEPVLLIEAAGGPEGALYSRAAQLQALWLVITGATAEREAAQASGDGGAPAPIRALAVLTALSEEESAAVNAAIRARSN